MVRTVGIDAGDHAVKIVELDGNYRKTRLLRVHEQVIADAATRVDTVASAARAAVDAGMKGEVFLGHPCREAVLRVIDLPFKGHEAIRKVVKAEIEGEIHSHVVDDMIVDFHELGAAPEGGTRVLVGSVPKEALRNQLKALTKVSIEPESVDLDTMALWRAAHWAGAFEDGAADPANAGCTAVVDVGSRSVKIILVEGEQLVEMRALRLGDAAIGEEVARHLGVSAAATRDAVRRGLATGSDQEVEVEDVVPATGSEPAPAAPTKRLVTVTHAQVEAAQTAFLQRLARELVRYLTSSGKASRIRSLWITGGASRTPGIREMLQEVFSIEPRELDLLGRLQHELDADQVASLGPSLATAIGLALTKLGGPTGFNLRQEDLAFTRGFERIKFPLAIACMLALLTLFVEGNRRLQELKNLELTIGRTHIDPKNPKAAPVFHGMLNSVLGSSWFENPQQFRLEQSKGKDYLYKNLIDDLVAAPVHRRIALVREKLKAVADQKQKESGVYEDVSLESGLAVLVRFAQVIKSVEPQLGRYLMMKLDLNMKAPSRSLDFVVALRGERFRDAMAAIEEAFKAEYAKPDSPFEEPKSRDAKSKEDLFKQTAGAAPGVYFSMKLRVKDSFQPFGPSKSPALGAAERAPQRGAAEVSAPESGSGAVLAAGEGEEKR